MAITPMKRRGTRTSDTGYQRICPLWDLGDWTISIGSLWRSDGPHRKFEIDLIHRIYTPKEGSGATKKNMRESGNHTVRFKTRTLTIPTVKFYTCYKYKRFGAYRLYSVQQKVLWWLVRR